MGRWPKMLTFVGISLLGAINGWATLGRAVRWTKMIAFVGILLLAAISGWVNLGRMGRWPKKITFVAIAPLAAMKAWVTPRPHGALARNDHICRDFAIIGD
jgi:hypothetical protein